MSVGTISSMSDLKLRLTVGGSAVWGFCYPLFVYWLSGYDFHRDPKLAFTFVVSTIFSLFVGMSILDYLQPSGGMVKGNE